MANLGGWHLVVILFIILLLFGAPKLPGLARSLGQSMKILKKEVGPEEAAKKEAAAKAEAAANAEAASDTSGAAAAEVKTDEAKP